MGNKSNRYWLAETCTEKIPQKMKVKKKLLYSLIFISNVVLLSNCTCSNENNRNFTQSNLNKKVRIYRIKETGSTFEVKVNDLKKYSFVDRAPIRYPFSLVTEVDKKYDSIRIYLKIDNKDTLFNYNLSGIDSILLGKRPDGSFYVANNHNHYAWAID